MSDFAREVREFAVNDSSVDGLIKYLQDLKEHGLPGETVIHAWDAEMEDFYPITVMTYENDGSPRLFLYTDEP